MGFDRNLLVDPTDTSFLCVRCNDIAIDPVKRYCGHILCHKCFDGYSCPDQQSCRKSGMEKLSQQEMDAYNSLKLKCSQCAKVVFITNFVSNKR